MKKHQLVPGLKTLRATAGPRHAGWARRQQERGFSLVLLTLTASIMIGTMGLAIDMGRMFIVKNELQTFVDAAAIAAATQLDGTQAGIVAANSTATAGPLGQTKPNGYNFDTMTVTPTVGFATDFTATYDSYATASAPVTNHYTFIKVSAVETIPLYFLPVIPGIGSSQAVDAIATAGAYELSGATYGGLVPFAPDAHNVSDLTNFGFTVGTSYTMKWGNGNTTTCAGDAGFNPGAVPSAHGFVDLGQGNGNSSLRSAIMYGGYPNANSIPATVVPGTTWLSSVPGNRGASIFSATAERSNQDPDQTSLTWAAYRMATLGNNRRIITVPIVDVSRATGHGSNYTYPVIGFGNFLLDLANTISGTSGPLCATYIGPGSMTSASTGSTDGTKLTTTKLFQ